jgi:guanylate kinase
MSSELLIGGKSLIVSAPSGSGKTTIVRRLIEDSELPLGFSVSATTREPRGTEQDGVDYHFMDPAAFKAEVAAGAFVEWEEVYPGRFYGTLRRELERLWAAGKVPVFDIDVVGGTKLRKLLGPSALAMFIRTPSINTLRHRLEARGTDSAETIDIRVAKAAEEWTYASEFDVEVVNDDLERACAEAKRLLIHHLNPQLA